MGKVCKKCGLPVVHYGRKWVICLDCLIDELIEQKALSKRKMKKYVDPNMLRSYIENQVRKGQVKTGR